MQSDENKEGWCAENARGQSQKQLTLFGDGMVKERSVWAATYKRSPVTKDIPGRGKGRGRGRVSWASLGGASHATGRETFGIRKGGRVGRAGLLTTKRQPKKCGCFLSLSAVSTDNIF